MILRDYERDSNLVAQFFSRFYRLEFKFIFSLVSVGCVYLMRIKKHLTNAQMQCTIPGAL